MPFRNASVFFSVFVCFFASSLALAVSDREAALEYAVTTLKSQIEFTKNISKVLIDPKISLEEKAELYEELNGYPLVNGFNYAEVGQQLLSRIPTLERMVQVGLGTRKFPLDYKPLLKFKKTIGEFLNHDYQDHESLIQNRIEQLFIEVYNTKVAARRIETLNFSRKKFGDLLTHRYESGVSLESGFDQIMKILKPHTPAGWREFIKGFEVTVTFDQEASTYAIHVDNPGSTFQVNSLEKLAQSLDRKLGLLRKKNPRSSDLEYLAELQSAPFLKVYEAYTEAEKTFNSKVETLILWIENSRKIGDLEQERRTRFMLVQVKAFINQEWAAALFPFFKMAREHFLAMEAEVDRLLNPSPQKLQHKKPSKKKLSCTFKNEIHANSESVVVEEESANVQITPFDSIENNNNAPPAPVIQVEQSVVEKNTYESKNLQMPEDVQTEEEKTSEAHLLENATQEEREVKIFSTHYYKQFESKGSKLKITQEEFDEKKRQFLERLKRDLSHQRKEAEFRKFFDDSSNHRYFTYEDMLNFVAWVGGSVTQHGTSHCHIVVEGGGVSQAWRPHGKDSKYISRHCVRAFRLAFEMAGITPETVFGR